MSLIGKYQKIVLVILAIVLSAATAHAQAPNLVSPTNGVTCQETTVDLFWNIEPAALSYHVQVSDFADFSNIIVDADLFPDTTFAFVGNFDITYYWRIASNLPGPVKAWSAEWDFTTKDIPPDFVNPVAGEDCVALDAIATWNSNPNADSYDLQVSPNADFSVLIHNITGHTDTTFALALTRFNTEHFTRVRSVEGSCLSDWNTIQFTTEIGPPQLIAPIDEESSIGLSVDLEWNLVPNATSYSVEVADNSDFDNPEASMSSITSKTVSVGVSNYNTTYYWRGKSSNTRCESPWSEANTFRTMYEPATLLIPGDSSECVPLDALFAWEPVSGAFRYRIQVASDSNFTSFVVNDSTVNDTTYNFSGLPPVSMLYWRVRAEDTTNTGAWSSEFRFVSAIRAPELLSPGNTEQAVERTHTFLWRSIGANAQYKLQISTDPNFEEPEIEIENISDTSQQVTLPEFFTEYNWRVTAVQEGCESTWSEVYSFKTIIASPVLVSPANGSTKQPLRPVCTWELVDGAESYEFQIAYDAGFNNHVPGLGKSGIPGNTYSPKTLEENTKFFWRVRGHYPDGMSFWSAIWSFTTGGRGPDIPQLVSPANNSLRVPVDLTCTWEDAARATSYKFQLALDPSFVQMVLERENIGENALDLAGLDNYTRYYWRVASVNDSGSSEWSEIWDFRTIALAPDETVQLLSPADEFSSVDQILILEWEGVERADAYEVQLATDMAFQDKFYNNRSVWNTKVSINGMDAATTYYWRVRGWNEGGDAPWSDVWEFNTLDWTGVELIPINGREVIYPNPASDMINIAFSLAEEEYLSIEIYNALGVKVAKIAEGYMPTGNKEFSYSTNTLAPGVYFVRIGNSRNYNSYGFSIVK